MAKKIDDAQKAWERKTQGRGGTFSKQVKEFGYDHYTKEFADFVGVDKGTFQGGAMADNYRKFVNRDDLESSYNSGVEGKGSTWKDNLIKAAKRPK